MITASLPVRCAPFVRTLGRHGLRQIPAPRPETEQAPEPAANSLSIFAQGGVQAKDHARWPQATMAHSEPTRARSIVKRPSPMSSKIVVVSPRLPRGSDPSRHRSGRCRSDHAHSDDMSRRSLRSVAKDHLGIAKHPACTFQQAPVSAAKVHLGRVAVGRVGLPIRSSSMRETNACAGTSAVSPSRTTAGRVACACLSLPCNGPDALPLNPVC